MEFRNNVKLKNISESLAKDFRCKLSLRRKDFRNMVIEIGEGNEVCIMNEREIEIKFKIKNISNYKNFQKEFIRMDLKYTNCYG